MIRLSIVVSDIDLVLQKYDQIRIYTDVTEGGAFTTLLDTVDMLPEKNVYEYYHAAGDTSTWYKTSYYHSTTTEESNKSAARQGGTEEEKIGYTFDNYSPQAGEWGKIYTADDMRYTMLFGVDCIAANTARDEFTDTQFDQLVLEAIGSFEKYLNCDIRKKVYKTNPASTLTRGRLWRAGVDYTD